MKAPRSNAPAYSILNPRRAYVPAAATDISKTIAAARRQLEKTGGRLFGPPPESPQQSLQL